MNVSDIERFFEDLNQRTRRHVRVILTGGAAGLLQGMQRATFDIDFEIRLKRGGLKSEARGGWESVQKAIERTAHATGITPQYDEDIDKWSSIALPSKRSRLYANFGKVEVRILNPELWAIGKLTRYLSTDIQDLRTVLKKSKVKSTVAVATWGKALGISPASSSQSTFRRQVETFLDQYAREIWGRAANSTELKRVFLTSAHKARQTKSR